MNHPSTGGRQHLHLLPCTQGPLRPPPSAWSTQTQGWVQQARLWGDQQDSFAPYQHQPGTPKLDGVGHDLLPTCGGASSGTGPVWAPACTLLGPQPPSDVQLRASLGWVSRAPEEQGSHPPCHGAWPSGYLGTWGGKSFGEASRRTYPGRRKLGILGNHPLTTCLMGSWPQTGPKSGFLASVLVSCPCSLMIFFPFSSILMNNLIRHKMHFFSGEHWAPFLSIRQHINLEGFVFLQERRKLEGPEVQDCPVLPSPRPQEDVSVAAGDNFKIMPPGSRVCGC